MMTPDIPPDVSVLAGKYGVPSFLLVALWWGIPKLWSVIKTKLDVATTTNDLTQAGLSGVTDVISTLRNQIADLAQQYKDSEQKLRDIQVTLEQAVAAKLVAEQEAAKAKSDLYAVQLSVERLQAQVRSLGAVPVV